MIKLLDILNEIGEASVKPFNWKKLGYIDAKTFKERQSSSPNYLYYDMNTFEFTTDKGTVYVVDMEIESALDPDNTKFDLGAINCTIDFSTKNKVGLATMDTTNKHEQYAVMSTITDIVIQWVNEWDKVLYIDKITIDPIKEDDEEGDGVDSSRGRLYHAFMKKQLSKLNKKYHIRVFDSHFEISPTFLNSNDPSHD